MVPSSQLNTASEYIAAFRAPLPREAFQPEPRHLVRIGCHLGIIAGGYAVLRETGSLWLAALISLLVGHSQASLVFLGHSLGHNVILKNPRARRALEMVIWPLNLIPPSLWIRLHNQTHHPEVNTPRDTDRVYRVCEGTAANRIYMRLFHPNRKTPLRHPLVFFHFITYVLRHLVSAFMPGDAKPSLVTYKPYYSPALKRMLLLELAIIAVLQVAMFLFLRGSWWRYLLAVPVPVLVASAVAMTYIYTQHFLNPLCERGDPVVGATSVIVPRWADWLHDNVSYHIEHHLFPGMNPRYYPEISRLLQQHFPERYNRIPFREAWRRIWAHDEFISEPDGLPGVENVPILMAAE